MYFNVNYLTILTFFVFSKAQANSTQQVHANGTKTALRSKTVQVAVIIAVKQCLF